MAKIISISLTGDSISKLEELSNNNFSGKSEAIRAALDILFDEQKAKSALKGKISAILLVIHKHSKHTLEISHHHQSIIKNHNHSHLKNEKCIDIFTLEGPAEEIKKIEERFRKDKRTSLAKLIII